VEDLDQARLTVDLDALAANLQCLRAWADGAEVAPVVKADAYGLGLAAVAGRLWREGARSYFVARVAEGEALRTFLPEAIVYVLDGCPPGCARRLAEAKLIPVLNSLPQIEAWSLHATATRRRAPAALHVDTGMNRLGLRPDEARSLADAPDRLRGVDLELVMSHLACAEDLAGDMSARQAERFAAVAALFPGVRLSLANSAGTARGGYGLDLVRPGVALYGGGPYGSPDPRLHSVATLDAPVLQVRSIRPGESVGYGATFVADRPMRAAVAAIGYADGVLRAGSGRGYGWLNGAVCAVLGRISMDLLALDVSACEAAPGDRVELFGPNIALDDAAAAAGTIAYELLTRVGPRVQRRYVEAPR
jgi:alanine racemase